MSPEKRRKFHVHEAPVPQHLWKGINLEALQRARLPWISSRENVGVTWASFRNHPDVPFRTYLGALFVLINQYDSFCYDYGFVESERHERNILVKGYSPAEWKDPSLFHIDAEHVYDYVRGVHGLWDEKGMALALEPGRAIDEAGMFPADMAYASSIKLLIYSLAGEKYQSAEHEHYQVLKRYTDEMTTLGGLKDALLNVVDRPNILPGGIDV